MPGLLVGPMAPLRLVTIDEPRRCAGRAGRGCAPGSPASAAPTSVRCHGLDIAATSPALVSMPFVPGHEVVGDLVEDCEDLPEGTRVVIDPVLACAARGVEPCEACRTGRTNLCDRITVGHLAPGLQTGFCQDTGGGWGERLTAHRSAAAPGAGRLPDDRAVLVEPLACAVQPRSPGAGAGRRPGARLRRRCGRSVRDARPA